MTLAQLLGVPLLLLAAGASARGRTDRAPLPPTPFDLCDAALAAVRSRAVPDTLLPSIARVESGRRDPASGRVRPWPWTVNVDGSGRFFDRKEDAVAAVRSLQAQGKRSIDVGCMQVNLMYHPRAFPTLDAAFDPPTNAAYALRFLGALYAQTHDWPLATAMYHSQTEDRGEDYQRLVFGRVMTAMGSSAATGAYRAFRPVEAVYAALPPDTATYGAFARTGRSRPGPPLLRRASVHGRASAHATARR